MASGNEDCGAARDLLRSRRINADNVMILGRCRKGHEIHHDEATDTSHPRRFFPAFRHPATDGRLSGVSESNG